MLTAFIILIFILIGFGYWLSETESGRKFNKRFDKFNNQQITLKDNLSSTPQDNHFDFELGAEPIAYIDYINANGVQAIRSIIVKDVFISDWGYWQVKAVDTNLHEIRQFRIERIVSLEHNGQAFYSHDDILNACEYLKLWM
mgnify:FL=1